MSVAWTRTADRGGHRAAALGLIGPLGWWGLIGLVPLGTALVGFCPLYPLIGVNTCPVDKRTA